MEPTGPDFRLRIVDRAELGADDSAAEAPVEASDPTALRAFSRAAQTEPADADYDFILGQGLLRAGRPGEAVARFRDAIRLDRQSPEYHVALGRALWLLQRFEEAEAAFREAAHLRPDPAALNAHGAALVRLGRASEAVEVLEKALREDARATCAHGNLGIALWHLGRRSEALGHLRRAARLDRRGVDALHNLAQALLASGHATDALRPLRMMTAYDPQWADAHVELGEALVHAGRHDEAEQAFARAASLDAAAIGRRPQAAQLRDGLLLARIRAEASTSDETHRTVADRAAVGLLGLAEALRGASRPKILSGIVLLAVAAPLTVVGGQLAYAAYRHYLLEDAIKAAARAPVRDEARVRDRLAHAVRRQGMQDVLDPSQCEISTSGEWRRIRCDYVLPLHLLPAWRRTLDLRIDVEEPFLPEPATKHL